MLEKLLTLQEPAEQAPQNQEGEPPFSYYVSPMPSTVQAGKRKLFKGLISISEEQAMGYKFVAERQ